MRRITFDSLIEANEILNILGNLYENAIVITDAQGKLLWGNKSFYDITGYTSKELLDKNAFEKLSGPKTDAAVLQYTKQEMALANSFYIDIIHYRKDGSDYLAHIHSVPVKIKGEVKYWIGISWVSFFENQEIREYNKVLQEKTKDIKRAVTKITC